RASFLLGLCLGGWCFFFVYLYYVYFINQPFPQYLQYFNVLITLISCGFFHLHYNSTIYFNLDKKYKGEKNPYKFIVYPVFFSLLFIIFPFLLLGIFFVISSFL